MAAGPSAHQFRQPVWRLLYFWVLIGILAGVAVGALWPAFGASLQPLGDGFIALVKMIIPPVIFLTVVTGIAGSHQLAALGRVVVKAFVYFLFFSTLALIVGLVIAHIVQPGAGMNVDPASLNAASVHGYAEKAHETSVTGFLLAVIPTTLVSAFTSGSILQILFVAVLFGVSLTLVGAPARPVTEMLERIALVVFRLVALVMWAAPVGAFGAMAFTIGKYGLGSLLNLGALVATFYATAMIFVLVILGSVAALNGFSILKLIRYLKAELLLVLGTSSSEAALPALIEKMQRAGCDKEVVGVVVPTGYSFNLDGTNIYMTLAALFIAQATGVELTLGEQLALLGVAMLSSKGAAGVTGSGFITLAATLAIVPKVPIAGMALILGVDRFMSECRSLTNFIGNAVATIVVARWEGALDKDKLARALDGAPDALPAAPPIESDPD
ncbi:aerobic C4-dicarboxylate transport protein [Sphingomonas naasensis]|uniref:C4-dicarboxylate transport protein n=1 Tax=Sphingomonas naasensis TaxID=1344951 RepID=A0A4S1WU72_9SPHN|nr:dicarboxylate/amino acid:cation symporter [Sphingomonas naasensis]NIJ18620.1 aerobic C4-dicarboxylate transport protein [Sphingomonas naasensis]TGX45867.1 dicarboxylate/amino acid:cation symporter [Sphingomonas naasensis]